MTTTRGHDATVSAIDRTRREPDGDACRQRHPWPASRPRLRAAEARDVDALRDVERAANRVFAGIGMQEVADLPATAAADWSVVIGDGRAWLAADAADVPIAFVVARAVDGNAHVDQVSVHPAWMRRGLGRRLVERVEAWARERGLPAMTLTTFVDVPWNAPCYRRLGFELLPDDRTGPALRAMIDRNAKTVLGRWPRIAMRRGVAGQAT